MHIPCKISVIIFIPQVFNENGNFKFSGVLITQPFLKLIGLNYHYHHAKLWNNEGGFSILFVKDMVNW